MVEKTFKNTLVQFVIFPILLFLFTCMVFVMCERRSAAISESLEKGFLNPPESAKPRVWWHWMNGNITKEGIRADLEWMKRVGFGGFQSFDAGLYTPQVVDKRLIYMTPEWKEAFLYATRLGDSLGLEMAIAGSPGWSETGGPWVKPAQAMKKFVWSEIRIEGGHPFSGTLPKPPTATGRFQNDPGGTRPSQYWDEYEDKGFYADDAVVAYRVPENDTGMADLKPKITSSGGEFDLTTLTDGDIVKSILLPSAPSNGRSWIQFEFSRPETFRSVTMAADDAGTPSTRTFEVSDNGLQFRIVAEIEKDDQVPQGTVTFSPVTARFFRVAFTSPAKQVTGGGMEIAELVLHRTARVNRFEVKAGFATATDLYTALTPSVGTGDAISKADVVDLTSMIQPDGKLNWTPPEGKWIVLRFGYSLTGKMNHPASPEATGLEVDKLNAEYVKDYLNNYLDQYRDATNGLIGEKGLQYVIFDSYEAGIQNWTDHMKTEFRTRRGYDILPWLPVLTGHIVESARASDRFLWDFRKTIADLISENHYRQLTALLRERDMRSYVEAHEAGRALIADGMEVKRNSDIPMSALWTPGTFGGRIGTVYKADIRESASVAHIYGQNLVAAESMTSDGPAWGWSPEYLKPVADMEFACGVNRIVQSVSVHSPDNDKIPGLSLEHWGPWLNRHETWAEQAKPWTTYLARSSYMLQQGKFVADILYFYGEDNNITALFGNKLPDIPSGYNYDFLNSDALVNVLSVNDEGHIITPGGMSYRLLALDPNSKYMSLSVLRKINEMVKAGAVVSGERPVDTPSLSDDQSEFRTLVHELWANEKGENNVGKGKIYAGLTVAEALACSKITLDFEYTKPQPDTELLFVHRKLGDMDIYWVNNRNDRVENIETTFKVKGKIPELWHPETGKIEEVSYQIADGRTTVPLRMEPNGALFVVFRKKAQRSSHKTTHPVETRLAVIDGPWNISFQPDRGAPVQVVFDKLTSWSDHADSGIRYFSGTASYTKAIQVSPGWFQEGSQIWIDLGVVKNLAEVAVNGKSLGIIWKKPFRINVTGALNPGGNTLEIKVTNLWVNRLIGDRQPGISHKYTYTTLEFYKQDSPLLSSGLLGPVTIAGLFMK